MYIHHFQCEIKGHFRDQQASEADTSAVHTIIYLCSLLTALIKPK